ncbi:MAG: PmoA family protein [Pirellulaceae bacterium]
MRRIFSFLAIASLVAIAQFTAVHFSSAADVQLEKSDAGVVVKLDGQPFTTYIFKSGAKPILWPIIGPTGKEMTRAYPMREGNKLEKTDHIHQRSFWFTHGNVNGLDFWAETAKPELQGRIEHNELVKAEGNTIVTKNTWLGPDGAKICADERTLRFGGDADARWIDFDVTVTALADKVAFNDTKEGSFGLRVDETLKVDAKMGGKIINAEGIEDAAAWGKASPWVDYHGPAQGDHVGIAILNHPSSFRFPSHWHVRPYGLFAANPFGLHDFSPSLKEGAGAHEMKQGEKFTLRYRVIFHKGDEKEGKIVDAFKKYSAQ